MTTFVFIDNDEIFPEDVMDCYSPEQVKKIGHCDMTVVIIRNPEELKYFMENFHEPCLFSVSRYFDDMGYLLINSKIVMDVYFH